MLEAVCVVARHTTSLALLSALASVCAALRAAARMPLDAGRVRRCFEQGHACVTRVIRAYCEGAMPRERMRAESIAEAVGAVQVHGVSVADLHARGWGWEYARLRHMCTLIVAGAVNVDTWRTLVAGPAGPAGPAGERWHDVYVWLPRVTDEWAVPR